MNKNRIALVSAGGVLGQIVRTALEQEPDLELVPARASDATEPRGLDLLILVLPGREAVSECRELLSRFPHVRVLAVLEDGRGDASLYELHPREARLGQLSPPELAQRIREVLQAARC